MRERNGTSRCGSKTKRNQTKPNQTKRDNANGNGKMVNIYRETEAMRKRAKQTHAKKRNGTIQQYLRMEKMRGAQDEKKNSSTSCVDDLQIDDPDMHAVGELWTSFPWRDSASVVLGLGRARSIRFFRD